MKKQMKKKLTKPVMNGLIGLFGHTYITDPDDADAVMIQYQYQIIRKMEGDCYVIQYFSFLDGSPNNVGVYPESELLGPNVKLYATADLWNEAYEKASRRRRIARESI